MKTILKNAYPMVCNRVKLFHVYLFVTFLCPLFLNAQPPKITYPDVAELATRTAKELWGDVYSTDPIPYYGPNEEIIAYHFTYAIGKSFPSKQSVIQQSQQAFAAGDRDAGWGIDQYGNMVVGAQPYMPVFIEHSKCLPQQYALDFKLKEAVEKHLGPGFSQVRIYYLGLVDVWYCYSNGQVNKYINLEPAVQVMDNPEFEKYAASKTYFWNRDEFTAEWQKFLVNKEPASKGDVYIPGYEQMPFYEWSYGCTPTSAAMLLAWWDNYQQFGNLIDYHMERWDTKQEEYDYHVPWTQYDLAEAMGTNYSTGSTQRWDICDGYDAVVEARGYNCSSDSHWAFYWTVEDLYDDVKEQINNNRPLHISIDNHSIIGIGYNNDSKSVMTHDPNKSTIRTISRSMLEATYWLTISNNYGTNVDLLAPDGGSEWEGNAGYDKETLESNDFFEISWTCPQPEDTYVKLYYHDEGGFALDRWFLIDDNTENDGEYIWQVPVIDCYYGSSTEHARIKIEVYDMGNNLIASDGSYGNFNIEAGGALPEISGTIATDWNPDFYSIHLENPTWSVVGIRDVNVEEFFYLNLFDDVSFSTQIEQCQQWQYVNYIVLDGHNFPTGWYGVESWHTGSIYDFAHMQFENDMAALAVNSVNTINWDMPDIVKVWDVYLTPGNYYFELVVDDASIADFDIALFKWGGDGVFPMNDREAYSANVGGGVNESFHYSPFQEGNYGLVVNANLFTGEDFELHIYSAGRWTGAFNTYWDNPANWSSNTVPTLNDNVVIPAGSPNYPVIWADDAFCNNLTIENGASLEIKDEHLNVYGDLTIFGELIMSSDLSVLTAENSIVWENGSDASITANGAQINVYKGWYFKEGCNIWLTAGTVNFVSGHPGFVVVNDLNSYFHDIVVNKTSASFNYNALSTQDLRISGNLTVNAGSVLTSSSEKTLILYDDLNLFGDVTLDKGTLKLDGPSEIIDMNPGSYFNHLEISTDDPCIVAEDMYLGGDLTLNSGGLLTMADIYIDGNWKTNLAELFNAGTNAVIFTGGASYCEGEDFYELEIAQTGLSIPSGETTCQLFKFTNGYLDVSGGTFTAFDLYSPTVSGEYFISDGEVNLHQDVANQVHLDADIYMSGGALNIYGGADDSYWASGESIEIHMQGGVIDFKDAGINIWDNPSTTIYTEITGGTIRTSGNLECSRPGFIPGGGIFELYGPDQTTISCQGSSQFYSISVDKGSSKKIPGAKTGKAAIPSMSPKSNNVVLSENTNIEGDMIITSGSLELNGYTLTTGNDLIVNDQLVMTNPNDLANIQGSVLWNDGAFANVTDGDILVGKDFSVAAGAVVQLGMNSKVTFIGEHESHIQNEAAGTSFAELELFKENTTIFGPSAQPTAIDGLFFANSQEYMMEVQDGVVNCNGTFVVDEACDIVFETGGELHANTQLNLHGGLYMNAGLFYCHDDFQISSTGHLHMNGGSFICDRAFTTTYYPLAGSITVNEGLFEVTSEGLTVGSSGSIDQAGGEIRIGWGLLATYPGNFQASGGVLEFIGPAVGAISFEASNYVHDLKVSRTGPGVLNNVNDLTINNDLWVVSNQFTASSHDVMIGGDVIIESAGILDASLNDLYVGGDWTNHAGDDGFLEGTQAVVFNGEKSCFILTDETFYDLNANIGVGVYPRFLWADEGVTISVNGNLTVNSTAFRLNDDATINIKGDLIIQEDAGLAASTMAESYINLRGDWKNYNTTGTPVEGGFLYGMSTVNFMDDFEAGLEAASGEQEFYNLKISKGIEHFYPYADITVHNDARILSGIWGEDESGMTYTFLKDLHVDWQGSINDYSNDFLFSGVGVQLLDNGSGTLINIGNLHIQKNVTITSTPLLAMYGDLHVNGVMVVDSGDLHLNNYTLECAGVVTVKEHGKVIAPGYSVIAMGSGSTLNVDGGQLELVGGETYHPKLTSTGGHYGLNILNGGVIKSVYAIYEYMDANGINIQPTGLTYGANTFSNCVFQNGTAGGTLLQINNSQDLVINGVEFPDNTWSGTSNVTKTEDQGSVVFTNYTGSFGGAAHEDDPHDRIGWDNPIPGIWTGAVSAAWDNVGNWKDNLKPTATDDVYIPAGTPFDCWVSTADHTCKSLTIETGATLRIYDHTLTVNGDIYIHGELVMDHVSSILNAGAFYGDVISWEPGSSANVSLGTINVFGNWDFKSGTSAQLGIGSIVNFYGANRSYIHCDDADASFGNLDLNKTAPPKDFVELEAGDSLRVTENLYLYDGVLKLNAGSYINVGNEFYVESGCTLSLMGSAAMDVTVSGYPNHCVLEISNGATIKAQYAIFEYLESNGLAINPTATIDPMYPLNYCTFREGKPGGSLLTVGNSQTITVEGAVFPPNTWGGTYNVSKPNDDGHLTFSNVQGVFVGGNHEEDPYNRIDWPGVVPGIWTGASSKLWSVLSNWKYQLKPTASDEVLIPAGCPNYPIVSLLPQVCKDIEIEAGASLEIYKQSLAVEDHLIINGELIMKQSASKLNAGDAFGDNLSWEPGSVANITAGTINVGGNWYFQDGTDAKLGPASTVNFTGSNLSYIYCSDADASFGNLTVVKSGGASDMVLVPPGNTVRVSNILQVNDGELQLNKDVELYVGEELHVNSGGALLSEGLGSSGNIISGYPEYCIMEIGEGGIIGAQYTTFEYMESSGLKIGSSAMIDPSMAFSFCTFREGRNSGTLLTINNDQVITLDGISFPTNTWGGNYNVVKTSNQGQIMFTDFSGDFSGAAFEKDPYSRIDWYHPWYDMDLKVFLEGPFGTTEMMTNLTAIPLDQPYDMAPWNYNGLESCAEVPADAVDWVLVEVRDAPSGNNATAATMVDRKTGFLMKDGRVKNFTGMLDLQFNSPISENMFVIIWHRNHLGVLSAYPLLNGGTSYSYDFTLYEDQVYGDIDGHKEIAPGIWGMIGGEGYNDGMVDLGDKLNVWMPEAGKSGYLMGDFNLDSQVDNLDKNTILLPNLGMESQVPD